MKKIILALLVFPMVTFAQSKNDNAILIKANGINEEKINNALISLGYPIDKSGAGYVITSPISRRSNSIKIAVSLKDSSYLVQGWVNSNITLMGVSSEFQQISFKGMKNSPMMIGWDEMTKIAKQISEDIKYIKL